MFSRYFVTNQSIRQIYTRWDIIISNYNSFWGFKQMSWKSIQKLLFKTTHGGARGKARVSKVSRLPRLGTMNVCKANPYNSYWDISVWIKVTFWLTAIATSWTIFLVWLITEDVIIKDGKFSPPHVFHQKDMQNKREARVCHSFMSSFPFSTLHL